ncbi:MAG: nuclease domain-containing protein [Nanoarchaeota archaeon]
MAILLETGEELPFDVYIKSSWRDVRRYEDSIEKILTFTKNKGRLSETAIEVIEFIKFKIEFKVNSDTKSILKIDNSSQEDYNIIINSGEEKLLSNTKFQWVPDDYLLEVQIEDETYYSCLKINAKNISSQQLKKMRQEVNKLVNGLVFDLSQTKNYGSVLLKQIQLVESDIHLLNYIDKNFKEIFHTLNDIIKNPLHDLEKNYEIRSDKFKIDRKGIKWLEGNKAQAINNSVYNPNSLYQKKMRFSINNMENKWIIKCIDYIRRKLNIIKQKLESGLLIYNKKTEKLEAKKNKYKKRINILNSLYRVTIDESEIKQRKDQIYGVNKEIEKNKEMIKIINNHLITTNRLLNNISMIFEKEIYDINRDYLKVYKPTGRLFKDRRYNTIYDFYQEIVAKTNIKKSMMDKTYQYKKTYKIYEYYILINIIRCLSELDYNWEDDAIKNGIVEQLIIDIPAGTKFVFKKNAKTINIYYDKEIDKHSDEELKNNNIEFFSNRKNMKPDFRIDIYEGNSHVKSFIIEVKYRRFRDLYDSKVDTEVVDQLNKYKDNIKRYPNYNNAISNVIVTYPEDLYKKEITNKKRNGNFIFIQLSPEQDESNEKQHGYYEFKSCLKNIL